MGVCQSDTRTKHEFVPTKAPRQQAELRFDDEQSQKKIVKIQSIARGQMAKQEVSELRASISEHQPSLKIAVPFEGAIGTDKSQVQKVLDTKFNHPARSEFKDLVRLPPKKILESGAVYKGQWLKGKRQGRGVQYWPDGSVYQGDWIQDQADGKGRLIHPDGDYYMGDWVKDRAQGKGIFVHVDGNSYEGDWVEDKQHGQGVEKQADFIYTGQFEHGLKHGKGRIVWKNDGSKYEGDFVDGLMHGRGKFFFGNGKVHTGEWVESKMHGEGELLYADGRKYVGWFQNGEKNGRGKMFYPDGKVFDGEWKNGKQNGIGSVHTSDGRVGNGIWENGRRVQSGFTSHLADDQFN